MWSKHRCSVGAAAPSPQVKNCLGIMEIPDKFVFSAKRNGQDFLECPYILRVIRLGYPATAVPIKRKPGLQVLSSFVCVFRKAGWTKGPGHSLNMSVCQFETLSLTFVYPTSTCLPNSLFHFSLSGLFGRDCGDIETAHLDRSRVCAYGPASSRLAKQATTLKGKNMKHELTTPTTPATTSYSNNEHNIPFLNHPSLVNCRYEMRDGDPVFVAKDVCAALGLSQVSRAMDRLKDKWKTHIYVPHPQNPNKQLMVNAVTEQGFYMLMFRSNKPVALDFQKWVAGEVVPSIRKHGVYVTPQKLEEALHDPTALDAMMQAAREAASEMVAKHEARRLENMEYTECAVIGGGREVTHHPTEK